MVPGLREVPRATKVALTACSSPSDSPLRDPDRPPGSVSTPSARPTRRVQADNAKQEGTGQIPTPGSGFEAPPPGHPGAQPPAPPSPPPPSPRRSTSGRRCAAGGRGRGWRRRTRPVRRAPWALTRRWTT